MRAGAGMGQAQALVMISAAARQALATGPVPSSLRAAARRTGR